MKSIGVLAIATAASMSFGIARGADTAADVPADAQKAALRKTVETCGTCHGVNGRSVSPDISEPGGTAGTLHRTAIEGLQGPIAEPIPMPKPTCGAWRRS